MIKALAIYALVVTLALAACGYLVYQQTLALGAVRGDVKSLTGALNQAEAQRKADARTLAARQARNAATARQLAQARQRLSEALQRVPAWSEADVPPEVQSALQRGSERSENAPD